MLYTLVFDSSKYMLMLWDKTHIASLVKDDDIDHMIDINGAPIRHKDVFTEPLRVSFEALYPQDRGLQVPDLCVFEGRLFLNMKAYNTLVDLIKGDGEFLDVIDEQGQRGFVFTPLRLAEDVGALDTHLCRKNEWGDVEHLAFYEEKIKDWSMFRTEYNGYMTLHCKDPVKHAIEAAGLTGLYITTDLACVFPQGHADAAKLN